MARAMSAHNAHLASLEVPVRMVPQTRAVDRSTGVTLRAYRPTSTSAQRDENRLTCDDRWRIRTRLAEILPCWSAVRGTYGGGPFARSAEGIAILERESFDITLGAINVHRYDLRESELAEISAMVAAAIDAHFGPVT